MMSEALGLVPGTRKIIIITGGSRRFGSERANDNGRREADLVGRKGRQLRSSHSTCLKPK